MKRILRAFSYAAVLATGTAAAALAAGTSSSTPAPMTTGTPVPGSQEDMSARTGQPSYSANNNGGMHNTGPTVVTPTGTGNNEGSGNNSSGSSSSSSTR